VFVVQLTTEDVLPKGFVPAHPSLPAWFASMFMHAGFTHIIGNMIFLWLFGTIAEDVLGPGLFLLFYFGGDIGATLLDILVSASSSPGALAVPRLGASGAIAGIMGLSAICFLKTKIRIWYVFWWILFLIPRAGTLEVAAPVGLGIWIGWEVIQGVDQAISGAMGGVGHWAHIGGFVFGMGGAVAMGLHKRIPRMDLISGRVPVHSASDAYQQAGELQKMVMDLPQDAEAWAALARDYEMTGRVDRAKEAHAKALSLFLTQRNTAGAAAAYSALNSYGIGPQLTPDQQFNLARALDDAGKVGDAFGLYRATANHHPDQQTAETALIRAAEIARTALSDQRLAADCYRQLLERFPYSAWRALAMDRLREMNVPQETAPEAKPQQPETQQTPADSDLRKL
jgi:membrane associated rhomboid family serine protease